MIDTHCHLHDKELFDQNMVDQAINSAKKAGLDKIILVGTSVQDSRDAIELAGRYPDFCRVVVGVHPHEATKMSQSEILAVGSALIEMASDELVVGLGECGLDFFYNDPAVAELAQIELLRQHLGVALDLDLPVSLHVRQAFDQFWTVLESVDPDHRLKAVLHSFTDNQENLDLAVDRGFMIGVNGIATFTKEAWQIDVYRGIPPNNIIIETDSPFLTPKPKRGTINVPENVIYITKFMADLKNTTVTELDQSASRNARRLFGL